MKSLLGGLQHTHTHTHADVSVGPADDTEDPASILEEAADVPEELS